jgi:hypothetical protein
MYKKLETISYKFNIIKLSKNEFYILQKMQIFEIYKDWDKQTLSYIKISIKHTIIKLLIKKIITIAKAHI